MILGASERTHARTQNPGIYYGNSQRAKIFFRVDTTNVTKDIVYDIDYFRPKPFSGAPIRITRLPKVSLPDSIS
jgi:hypothetical protein